MSKRLTLKSLLNETKKMINFGGNGKGYFKEDTYRQVCLSYSQLETIERYQYLSELSHMHDYSNEKFQNLLVWNTTSDILKIRRMYNLKESLQPKYRDFFINLGRVSDGIKLLVDLRSDIVDIQNQILVLNSNLNILGSKKLAKANYSQDISTKHAINSVDEAGNCSFVTLNDDEEGNIENGPDGGLLSSHESKDEENKKKLDNVINQFIATENAHSLHVLNSELKDLINVWFAGGFCQMERVTWHSSCQLLQRISELEAVHPVRGWVDIKRRVGPYRRCYVFTHPCMPNEPVVILHTALCQEIPSSIREIVSRSIRKMHMINNLGSSGMKPLVIDEQEEPTKIVAAVFYSISSPHRGLNGIDLGNTLIKRVVQQLRFEHPHLDKFCTLSPLPGFRKWVTTELNKCIIDQVNQRIVTKSERDESISNICRLLNDNQITVLSKYFETTNMKDLLTQLDIRLSSVATRFGGSFTDSALQLNWEYKLMSWILTSMAAKYLCREKYRGFAFDSVCNFHLKNGAMLWRINWMGDSSPRGIESSYGVMVNYRYYIDRTAKFSRQYLDEKVMQISPEVKAMLKVTPPPSSFIDSSKS